MAMWIGLQMHDDVIKWKQFPRYQWLLALCERNPPITGGFQSHGPGNAGFDVFFDVSLNKRLNKQSNRRRFESPGCLL